MPIIICRLMLDVEQPTLLSQAKPLVLQFECQRDKSFPTGSSKSPPLTSAPQLNSSMRNPSSTCSSTHEVGSKIQHRQEHGSTSTKYGFMPNIAHDCPSK